MYKNCLNKLFKQVVIKAIHSVDKKQVVLLLPFQDFCHLKLGSVCYIPYCSLNVVFQSEKKISHFYFLLKLLNI